MIFIPPVPLIRKRMIIKKLSQSNALSPGTAVTFAEAGVINPNAFRPVTRMLVKQGRIIEVENTGRYYLNIMKM